MGKADAKRVAAVRTRSVFRLLLLIPFLWQIALVPLVNRVHIRICELPFPMAWQMIGVVITTVVIAIVYRMDRRHDTRMGEGEVPQ